jgi:hypothetical protein
LRGEKNFPLRARIPSDPAAGLKNLSGGSGQVCPLTFMNAETEAPTQISWTDEDKLRAMLLYLSRLVDDGVKFRLTIDLQPRSEAEAAILRSRFSEFTEVFQCDDK